MKSITIKTLVAAFVISLAATVGVAAQKASMDEHATMDHGTMKQSGSSHAQMDHSKMGHSEEGQNPQAMGVGVIHSVSKLNRMVNLTHEPIPALHWQEMTMDLPVAQSVDLGTIKIGEKIKFHIELGEDKKYIITQIMK